MGTPIGPFGFNEDRSSYRFQFGVDNRSVSLEFMPIMAITENIKDGSIKEEKGIQQAISYRFPNSK